MLPNAVTVEQIQKMDDIAINEYGVPSIALMENAGRTMSNEVRRMLKDRKTKNAIVVCGVGNNAGDGFVMARHLANANFGVHIFQVGKSADLKKDAAINYKIIKNMGIEVKEIESFNEEDATHLGQCDVVVDAIFGVGLSRTIEEPYKSIIETMNNHSSRIVSVDIPSGLNGTTGEIYGTCIKANRTITFSFAKEGFYVNEGPNHVGKVVVREIGIPVDIHEKFLNDGN